MSEADLLSVKKSQESPKRADISQMSVINVSFEGIPGRPSPSKSKAPDLSVENVYIEMIEGKAGSRKRESTKEQVTGEEIKIVNELAVD